VTRISVVICSRDRAKSLGEVLRRYRELLATDRDWDLVVVDDGSRDETPDTIALAQESFGGRLTPLRSGGVGLGAARNRGWPVASGDLVLFTDDDCYPDPDLFTQVRVCFAEAPIDFLGGRVMPYTPDDAAIATVTRAYRVEVAGRRYVSPGLLPGANLTVRRMVLEAAGGFDPDFGAGTPWPAEDVELVARLAATGFRGAYDPRPVVFHHHGRATVDAQTRLLEAYDRGRGGYYAKCLTNPRLRWVYLRAWLRSARKRSPINTARELRAAVAYWRRR
jgi:glycosyltransferase involved in cell wall biosynthesis